MFVHGRHMGSQYCLLASTKASYLKFWNDTKFHFLLARHFIDTLNQAISQSLYYVIRKTNICLVIDTWTVLA